MMRNIMTYRWHDRWDVKVNAVFAFCDCAKPELSRSFFFIHIRFMISILAI